MIVPFHRSELTAIMDMRLTATSRKSTFTLWRFMQKPIHEGPIISLSGVLHECVRMVAATAHDLLPFSRSYCDILCACCGRDLWYCLSY